MKKNKLLIGGGLIAVVILIVVLMKKKKTPEVAVIEGSSGAGRKMRAPTEVVPGSDPHKGLNARIMAIDATLDNLYNQLGVWQTAKSHSMANMSKKAIDRKEKEKASLISQLV